MSSIRTMRKKGANFNSCTVDALSRAGEIEKEIWDILINSKDTNKVSLALLRTQIKQNMIFLTSACLSDTSR